jgi:tetratricopeptide (TPR) repeat protein
MTTNRKITIVGAVLLLFFVAAAIFPNVFWGGHHIAFLPIAVQGIIFLLIGYLMFVYPSTKGRPLQDTILKPLLQVNKWPAAALVAGVMGIIFYAFPIHFDTYGDALYLFSNDNIVIKELTQEHISWIYSFDYTNPKLGTETTFSVVICLSYLFETSIHVIFRIWDALLGAIFIFLWLRMTTHLIKDNGWKIVVFVLGLTVPFLQTFFGHFEIYAPVMVCNMAYFYGLILFVQSKKGVHLVRLILLFFLCLKFHVTTFLLLPTLFLAVAWWLTNQNEKLAQAFTWKNVGRFVILPGLLIAVALYFLKGSANSLRTFDEYHLSEVLFLPIQSPESAPLDRYNMFSSAHFFDYFNMLFLWSSAALFILISIVVAYRKKIDWNEPRVIIMGTCLLAYVGFYFIMNPLLSMPNDWDVFSMPAIPLLVLIMVLINQLRPQDLSKQLMGGVVALSLFGPIVFTVNATQEFQSKKLEAQGIWEFKTYWLGSSTSIREGVLLEEDEDKQLDRMLNVVEELEPHAVLGNDIEYASLLQFIGRYYHKRKNYEVAIEYFEQSDAYSTYQCKNHYFLLTSYFWLEQYEKAHEHGQIIIDCQEPGREESYMMAIHTALEAGKKIDAMAFCEQFLAIWPNNKFVRKVRDAILAGEDALRFFARIKDQKQQSNGREAELNQLLQFNNITSVTNDSLINLATRMKIETAIDSNYYGTLLQKIGDYYQQKADYTTALLYFGNAEKYLSEKCKVQYQQLICNFMLQQFEGASTYSDHLISCAYPNERKAYKVAIHTAVEAQNLVGAQQYCERYIAKWPEDKFIQKVNQAIANGKSADEVRAFFRQK